MSKRLTKMISLTIGLTVVTLSSAACGGDDSATPDRSASTPSADASTEGDEATDYDAMIGALTDAGFVCETDGPDEPDEPDAPEPLRVNSSICTADGGDGIPLFVELYATPEDADQRLLSSTSADVCATSWSDPTTLVSDSVLMSSEALEDLGYSHDEVVETFQSTFDAIGFAGPLTCYPPA